MRGAVQTGIRQIEVRDVPEPPPVEGMALVRVRAAGICGSDLHPYHGRPEPQPLPEGHEVSGEVIDLPPDYHGPIRSGDRVAMDTICLGRACGTCAFCLAGQPFHCAERRAGPYPGGGFAEVIRRRPAGLFRLPDGVTFEQGALIEPFAVAVHAVRYARMPAGASVAVIGAGTIGQMTLLAARAFGAGPIHVLARHAHQATLAAELGATTVARAGDDEAVEQIRVLTGG
ncbi:MAG: zinc-dependent alcohol dehydrogenase, partial [Candidatus Dormibacteraceae bacterium]